MMLFLLFAVRRFGSVIDFVLDFFASSSLLTIVYTLLYVDDVLTHLVFEVVFFFRGV
jgi:hypothetical protein